MSNILASVDSRTKLVGENRLELLMFRLKGSQTFAINVFKVQEVVQMPPLTAMPKTHPAIRGVAHLRGRAVPVIDLSIAIGRSPLQQDDASNLIVTEYNQSVQGFFIGAVDRIINLNWDTILPPPKGTGNAHFLTAFTRVNEKIVEILDVERVLADIIPLSSEVSSDIKDDSLKELVKDRKLKILSVDDSPTARKQIKGVVDNLELDIELFTESDGLQGLHRLRSWADEGLDVADELLMLITDAEMPEMDGYRLTHEIRNDPKLQDLHVIMHTSLSGSFNNAMVEKVGCNGFLSKFQPDQLANFIQDRIREKYS